MLSSWKSLCEHHTQVECIPADQPHLVAIDGIEVFCPNDDASFHEADHLPLEKMPAFRAAENYWGIFDPLIQQRMKSHGAVAP
jgi:hypothetical protein